MKMPDLKKPIRYILAAVFVGVAAFLVFAAKTTHQEDVRVWKST